MGYVGKVALAAHGVALLWLNVALMIPIGISQAAMARIAMLSGQRRPDAVLHATVVAVLSVVAASAVMGALLVAASDDLIRLAMWSRSAAGEAVVDTGRGYFRFCAITQLLSGLVIVMASILRGLGDNSAVLWLVMLGYWGVGLGGCALLAFVFGLGGAGIWMRNRAGVRLRRRSADRHGFGTRWPAPPPAVSPPIRPVLSQNPSPVECARIHPRTRPPAARRSARARGPPDPAWSRGRAGCA